MIVPTRNGATRLPGLLEALEAQSAPPHSFELLVVDDGSDPGLGAPDAGRRGRLIRTSSLGQGGASNVAAAEARGEILAFTDDDTVPAPDWIASGLARFDAADADVVAGRIEMPLGERPTVAALVEYGRGYLDQSAYVADNFGATANLWVRRELFERLGGFRRRGQGHDRDFGERVIEAGHTIEYADEVVVVHPPRARVRDLARKEYRLGFDFAELRRASVGEVASRRPMWSQLEYYRPWRRIWGLDRLRAAGYRPSLRQRLAMRVVQYSCVQLPLVLGDIRGTLAARR